MQWEPRMRVAGEMLLETMQAATALYPAVGMRTSAVGLISWFFGHYNVIGALLHDQPRRGSSCAWVTEAGVGTAAVVGALPGATHAWGRGHIRHILITRALGHSLMMLLMYPPEISCSSIWKHWTDRELPYRRHRRRRRLQHGGAAFGLQG